jgi:hypothetical protein
LRVRFVAAPLEEASEETLWTLKRYLEMEFSCQCSRVFGHLPELSAGETEASDCLLLLAPAGATQSAWLQAAASACQRGQGVVAIGVDAEASSDGTPVHVAPGAENHPALRYGLASLAVTGRPSLPELPERAQVVLTSPAGPVAWSWKHGSAGIFWTWLGQTARLTQPEVRKLLQGALPWSVGRGRPQG